MDLTKHSRKSSFSFRFNKAFIYRLLKHNIFVYKLENYVKVRIIPKQTPQIRIVFLGHIFIYCFILLLIFPISHLALFSHFRSVANLTLTIIVHALVHLSWENLVAESTGGARRGPLFWVKKEEITEGRKGRWASKIKTGPSLAQRRDLPVWIWFSVKTVINTSLLSWSGR